MRIRPSPGPFKGKSKEEICELLANWLGHDEEAMDIFNHLIWFLEEVTESLIKRITITIKPLDRTISVRFK